MEFIFLNKTARAVFSRKITVRATEALTFETSFTGQKDLILFPYSATSGGIPSNSRFISKLMWSSSIVFEKIRTRFLNRFVSVKL
jgi:hypothetical protein